jgi:hypothetical protein
MKIRTLTAMGALGLAAALAMPASAEAGHRHSRSCGHRDSYYGDFRYDDSYRHRDSYYGDSRYDDSYRHRDSYHGDSRYDDSYRHRRPYRYGRQSRGYRSYYYSPYAYAPAPLYGPPPAYLYYGPRPHRRPGLRVFLGFGW